MTFGPLATTSVGSFPRPTWLAHTKRNQLTYRLDGDELKEAMDDAMALVICEQEELGLDILTDGEMRRTTFVFHIAGRWDGVDIETQVNKQIYRNREANRMVPRIVGKIVAQQGRGRRRSARGQVAHQPPDENGGAGADDGDRQHAQRILQRRSGAGDGRRRRDQWRTARLCRRPAARCCRSTNRR